MIGVYNHLLSKVFRFHYHSQEVIGFLQTYRNFHGSIVDTFEQCTCPQMNDSFHKKSLIYLHWFIAISTFVFFLGGHSTKKTIKSAFFHGSYILYIYVYIYIYMMYLIKTKRGTGTTHIQPPPNETQTRHRVVTKSESPESTAQATAPRPSCGQREIAFRTNVDEFF